MDIEKNVILSQGETSENSSTKDEYGIKEERTVSNFPDDFSDLELVVDDHHVGKLKRGLKARHIAMITLGGTIGTGLFIGSGTALAQAGPVGALIAYAFFASIVYSVAFSLGEMAAYIPISGSFTQFTARFVSPSLGFGMGWIYWFSWAITFAIELNATSMIIDRWTHVIPAGGWIGIFFVIVTAANLLPVKVYGEVEFWVASIKVIAIVGWLIYALCMVCGAGITGPVGFRYWRNPGPMGPGYLVESNVNTGRFLGWLSAWVNAAFTFQGTELVGITAGETANPRKTIPSAINKVFYRIVIFYLLTIFFIGLLVPYNDPALTDEDETYAAASPFIIAMVNSGTAILPDIFNAVILLTVISAANSNVYIGGRIIVALVECNVAPRFMGYTNRWGVPIVGVLMTAAFGLLALLNIADSASTVFNWLVNITTVAGLVCWALISLSHIYFIRALKSQGIARDSLPFIARWNPIYAWYAFLMTTLVTLVQGFSCFWDFTASSFLTAYVSLILFAFLVLCHYGYTSIFRPEWGAGKGKNRWQFFVHPRDADLDSGRREIESECWEDNVPSNWWEKLWAILA